MAHRLKRAGYPSLLTWIRADIYLGRLDGRYDGLTDEQLFAHLMTHPVPQPAPDPEPATADDERTEQEWADYYDHLIEHGLIHLDDLDDPDDPDIEGDAYEHDASNGTQQHGESPDGKQPHGESPDREERDGEKQDSEKHDGEKRNGDEPQDGEELNRERSAIRSEHDESSHSNRDEPEAEEEPPDDPGDDHPGPEGGPHRPDGVGGGPVGGAGGSDPATPECACPDVPDTHQPRAYEAAQVADDASQVENHTGAGPGGVRGRGLRLLVGLTPIAGLDRRPGDLLGFGFVHAELARRISAAAGASWHYALVQPDGTPIHVGPIRLRPIRGWAEGHSPDYRHLEVWLQLTPDELARLTRDPPPRWESLLAALAEHIGQHPGGPPNDHPDARLPGTPLRRWIHIRDRRCVFPGCRVAPHRTDADHSIEHRPRRPNHRHQCRIGVRAGPCRASRARLAGAPTRTGPVHLDQPRSATTTNATRRPDPATPWSP